MLHKKLISYLKSRTLILTITLTYTLIVALVLLNRFWQYEAYYYDHGMMEGTAYQVSQFHLPLIHRDFGKVPVYIDHFYPSLQLTLAPFYWINNSYETPLIILSLYIGLSVLAGYEIGRKYIKNKYMLYTLLFAYMFYIGMQNALIFLIHDITVQILFLMLLFLAIVYRKVRLYYLLLILNLGFKESVSITIFAVGIFLFFFQTSWRKHALITCVVAVIYALLASKLIIPYFRYHAFGTWDFAYSPQLGISPTQYLTYFFNTDQKRETIFTSLSSFGFLPLFSPSTWILLIQDFAQRFVLISPNSTLRQGLNLHYNANLAVLLYISSVFSIHILERKTTYKKVEPFHALCIILITMYFHQLKYHGPLGLIYNKDFFRITKNLHFMDEFVSKIPPSGKVMVQNNLAPRFTHNDLYILISQKEVDRVQPDVIAMDFRPGQNINNYWPMTENMMSSLSGQLLSNGQYRPIFKEQYRYIFVKNN